ncbi:MAG: hypothetical protein JSU00_24135 [Acidobacteria bacterium]|nr:hypothetical protein [Acidobacteriota bacterium]
MEKEPGPHRILIKHFLNRLFDSDLVSAGGSLRDSAITTVSLLAATGVIIAYTTMMKHWFTNARTPLAIREAMAWSDREFMISISMAVTAALAVLCWESVFPDSRDCLILTSLPIRGSSIIAAKLAVLGLVLVTATVSLNFATSFFFPIAMMTSGGVSEGLRFTAGHFLAVGAASLFAFVSMLAAHAALANLLPFRVFQRVSAWVQLAALFGVLFLFFVIPPIATFARLTDPANRQPALWLPPFWFLGLYQEILGTRHPFIHELAARAMWALGIAVATAALLYAAGYRRIMRRTIEESGAVGESGRRRWTRVTALIDGAWLGRPSERAAFHFVWRTMTRHRGHRLMLAAYAALGLVYLVDGVASLVNRSGGRALMSPNTQLSAFPLVLPFFVLLGLRALFSVPVELPSNWLFRLTETGRAIDYVTGARKLMTLAGVAPACLLSLPFYGFLWGWRVALTHEAMCVLIALTTLEVLMAGFPKVPFTCPFLPGQGNLKVTFATYVVLFLSIAYLLIHVELWMALDGQRGLWGVAMAGAAYGWALRRRWRLDAEQNGITWEEAPVWHMQTLELSQ